MNSRSRRTHPSPGVVGWTWVRTGLVWFAAVAAAVAAEPVPQTFDEMIRTPPAEFSADDAVALERLAAQMRSGRERLQREQLKPAEQAELARQVQALSRQAVVLAEKRATWREYTIAVEGKGARTPELVRADSSVRLDLAVLTGLFERFNQLDRRRDAGGRPTAAEWEAMGRAFSVLHPVRYALTARDPAARYLLRAMLLEGQCSLYAAVEHHRARHLDEFERTYDEGLRRLDAIVRLFASAERMGEEVAVVERLPVEPARFPLAFVGMTRADAVNGFQPPTSNRARRLLADFCPWGYQVWATLREAGIARAIDPTVLRPFSGNDPRHLSVMQLRESVVPRAIRSDLDALRAGKFTIGGEKFKAVWKHQSPPRYELWVASPAVHDMPLSEKFAWVVRAVKLAKGGWTDVIADELKDLALALVANVTQEQGKVYATCVVVRGVEDAGVTYNFLVGAERLSRFELGKEIIAQSLSLAEEREVQRIFGNIDPRDSWLQKTIGWPQTYVNEPMPLVLLRADFVAEKAVPDLQYRQFCHYIVYYYLDPRGLFDRIDEYDLRKVAEYAANQRSAYLAGEEKVERATWRQLPDTPKPWGARLYVTDLTPSGQALTVKFGGETLANWRKGMKPDEVLVAQLWTPAPDVRCLITAEIDRPELVLRVTNASRSGVVWPLDLRFHGRECASKELFTEYTLRVGVASRAALRVAGDRPPSILERDVTTLRYVSREGRPVTGTLSVPTTSEAMTQAKVPDPAFIQLTFEWGRGVAPKFEVDPKGHDWPLLPPRLVVEGVTGPSTVVKSGVKITYPHYERTIELSASITPVDPGWHELTVEIGGRPYRVWSRVEGRGAAAIFKATLPVPVGEAVVVVRAKNAAPVQFKSFREPNPAAAALDTGKWMRTLEEYALRVSRATRVDQRMSALNDSLDKQVAFARAFIEADLYAQARPLLQKALRQWPAEALQAQGDPRSGIRIWNEDFASLQECLIKTSYALGDTAGLVAAVRSWFTAQLRGVELSAREWQRPPVGYYNVAKTGAEWIQMGIHLGVPPAALRELIALYGRARQADGFYQPPYDEFEFLFPPEGN